MNAEDVDTKVTFMCELIESAENIKASGLITLSVFENIKSVTRYYKLQDSSLEAPLKPTVDTLSEWSTIEPPYESSKLLYYCDITTLSTGEWIPSEVSVSGIYQSLQDAYNKIDENDKLIQSWCSENNKTLIDGGKIYTNQAFANSIFANDITAIGTITGATLIGANISTISGRIGPFELSDSGLEATKVTTAGIYLPYKIGTYGGYIQIGAYPDESNWNDPIVINGYEAGWCVMRHDGMRVGGKYDIASTYQDDCLIAGELNVVNGATIDNGALIKLGAIIHGGAIINNGAYVSGDITVSEGNICLDNSRYLYGDYNGNKRLAAIGTTGNIYFGEKSGTGGMYAYISKGQNYRVFASTDENECFSSMMHNGHRYFRSKPIYDRTSGSSKDVFTVKVDSNGYLFRTSSSMRYKENITTKLNPELDPERLYDLNVWQYNYRDEHFSKNNPLASTTYIGFIAEDVKQHYPIAALINDEGYAESWDERTIIPPMLKLIQNQHKDIELLKQQINSLIEGGTYEREIN